MHPTTLGEHLLHVIPLCLDPLVQKMHISDCVCVQVQRRIQEELDIKVGGDRSPQLSDRGSLPYLEATIREVLRIRPVAPLLIPHVALSDTRYTQLLDTHLGPFIHL